MAGKKNPRNARAKKRVREAVEELQEQQAADAASQSVRAQKDDELFVLDYEPKNNIALPTKKQKRAKKQQQQRVEEQGKVAQLIKKYGGNADQLAKVARRGRSAMQNARRRSLRGKTKANFDLWDSEESKKSTSKDSVIVADQSKQVPITAKAQRPKVAAVAVDIAKPGQSYHPDPVGHKIVLRDALEVELARETAVREQKAPVSTGMSAETRALLVGDTDSEDEECDDSDGEEEEVPDLNMAVGPLPTRADKKTRAQRNKEKRLRQAQAIVRKRKASKKLVNEISEVHRYSKEFKRDVRKKEEQKQAQKPAAPTPGTNLHLKLSQQTPMQAPTLPVALSSELESVSLRTIQPKGSLATDRLVSLMDRNLAPKPTNNPNHFRGKRRKKAVKGSRNNQGKGGGFVVKG